MFWWNKNEDWESFIILINFDYTVIGDKWFENVENIKEYIDYLCSEMNCNIKTREVFLFTSIRFTFGVHRSYPDSVPMTTQHLMVLGSGTGTTIFDRTRWKLSTKHHERNQFFITRMRPQASRFAEVFWMVHKARSATRVRAPE